MVCFEFQVICTFFRPTDSGAVQLTAQNLDMTLGKLIAGDKKVVIKL